MTEESAPQITIVDDSISEPVVETIPIDELLHDEDNPNVGTSRTPQLLDYSIGEFGFLESGTIDRYKRLVGGNKRIEAARRAGYTHVVIIRLPPNHAAVIQDPTLDLESEDPEERAHSRQAGYSLNFSAANSIKISPEILERDIKSGMDFSKMMTRRDIIRIGVQQDKPNELESEPYRPPENPEEAQREYNVNPGDVWRLGRHTLVCQDCTSPQLPVALKSSIPALVVTSPPYGVGKDYESSDFSDWLTLIRNAFTNFFNHRMNLVAVNLADKHTGNDGWDRHTFGELVDIMSEIGYSHLNTRVWVKQPAWSQTPYWRTSYKTVDEYEYIGLFAAEKPSFTARLTDEENNNWGYRSVWEMTSVQSNDIHTAMFPLELPLRLIRIYTDPDDIVFEPFAGSGTTIIAAEATRRTCIATEILPEYCAVAIKRFHEVTHIEPVRESMAEIPA